MKLTEIMIIRNIDNEPRLKTLLVDDNVLARLTKIRGNLYRDDSRLRTMADIPTMQQPQTPEPEPKISPEMQARAEASYRAYKENERKAATTCATIMTPEPQKPMTFEETLENDWRFNPGIRKEFVSQASYEAYVRAEKAGRVRVCGRG